MSDDTMVEIARLLSRPETLTVQAMLDAAGILCHVGGDGHGSIEYYPLALGGYRLTVPACQHADASVLIADMLAQPSDLGESHTDRVWALALFAAVVMIPTAIIGALFDREAREYWLLTSLDTLATPGVPQGRADYTLSRAVPGPD